MILKKTAYDFFSKKHDIFIIWFVYIFPGERGGGGRGNSDKYEK